MNGTIDMDILLYEILPRADTYTFFNYYLAYKEDPRVRRAWKEYLKKYFVLFILIVNQWFYTCRHNYFSLELTKEPNSRLFIENLTFGINVQRELNKFINKQGKLDYYKLIEDFNSVLLYNIYFQFETPKTIIGKGQFLQETCRDDLMIEFKEGRELIEDLLISWIHRQGYSIIHSFNGHGDPYYFIVLNFYTLYGPMVDSTSANLIAWFAYFICNNEKFSMVIKELKIDEKEMEKISAQLVDSKINFFLVEDKLRKLYDL